MGSPHPDPPCRNSMASLMETVAMLKPRQHPSRGRMQQLAAGHCPRDTAVLGVAEAQRFQVEAWEAQGALQSAGAGLDRGPFLPVHHLFLTPIYMPPCQSPRRIMGKGRWHLQGVDVTL